MSTQSNNREYFINQEGGFGGRYGPYPERVRKSKRARAVRWLVVIVALGYAGWQLLQAAPGLLLSLSMSIGW